MSVAVKSTKEAVGRAEEEAAGRTRAEEMQRNELTGIQQSLEDLESVLDGLEDFTEANKILLQWPKELRAEHLLRRLAQAIREGNINPELHNTMIHYLCGLGESMYRPDATTNNNVWRSELHLWFVTLYKQPGALRIFSITSGSYQRQPRRGHLWSICQLP